MNRTDLENVTRLVDALQQVEADTGLHLESVTSVPCEVRNADGDLVTHIAWVAPDDADQSPYYDIAPPAERAQR